MKRILASLVMIVLASVSAVGATRAYFNDTVSLNDAMISTGSINIDISANDSYYMNPTRRTVVPVQFIGLKPGDTVRQWVTFTNTGSLPIDYLTVTKDVVSDDKGILSQIIVSATGGSQSAVFTRNWDAVRPTISSWFTTSDILDVAVYRTGDGQIQPGANYQMVFDFIVPTTVGNDYQNASATFNLEFFAEQVH